VACRPTSWHAPLRSSGSRIIRLGSRLSDISIGLDRVACAVGADSLPGTITPRLGAHGRRGADVAMLRPSLWLTTG
jgi:hypothetical protein